MGRLGISHEALEALAAIEHERWAHWQIYLHDMAEEREDGALILPPALVEHLEERIATPYEDLKESEKQSAREQVKRYLTSITRAFAYAYAAQESLESSE